MADARLNKPPDVDRLLLMIAADSQAIAFEYESIVGGDNDALVVRLQPISAEDSSFIEKLRANQDKPIGLAYGLKGLFARLEGANETVAGGETAWALEFSVVYAGPTAATMELGFSTHSVADLARLRARRLLLNEPLASPYPPGDLNTQTLEMFVQGFEAPVKIKESPIPALYHEHKTNPKLFSAMSRLFCSFLLIASGTVRLIERLRIELEPGKGVRVEFAGVRQPTYIDRQPERITVDGHCLL